MHRVCSIVLLFLYLFLFISIVFKSLVLEALVVVAAYLCLSLSSVIKLYYELYLLFRDTDCKVGMARSPIYVISCVLFRCNIHVHVLSLSNETIKKKVKNNRQSFPSFFKQKCVNLLFFFIIDDSTWSVFQFWTVGWTKEEILKTSLWALGHFDEQISQLFEILYEKQMADLMIRAVYNEVGRKSKRKCHIGSAARDIALWVIQLPNRGGSWALNHMMS